MSRRVDPDSRTARAIELVHGGISKRRAAKLQGITVGAIRTGIARLARAHLVGRPPVGHRRIEEHW